MRSAPISWNCFVNWCLFVQCFESRQDIEKSIADIKISREITVSPTKKWHNNFYTIKFDNKKCFLAM